MKRPSVMICIPAYGQQVAAQTMESVYSLAQFLTINGVRNQLSWYSAADIVEVRNLFITTWYDCYPQFSHMLFIDADMGFSAHMVRDMLKFDKPLVGTFYAKRQMKPTVVGAPLDPDVSYHDMREGHVRANYVGGGVMLIRRDVVKTMLEEIPEAVDKLPSFIAASTDAPLKRFLRLFDCILEGDRRLSEDVSFCIRWREYCKGEIWANVDYQVDHVGPFNFHMRYAGILENELKQKAENVENAA